MTGGLRGSTVGVATTVGVALENGDGDGADVASTVRFARGVADGDGAIDAGGALALGVVHPTTIDATRAPAIRLIRIRSVTSFGSLHGTETLRTVPLLHRERLQVALIPTSVVGIGQAALHSNEHG